MSTSGIFVLLCLGSSCCEIFEAGEHRRTRFRSGKLAGDLESFRRFVGDVLWGTSDTTKAMVRSLELMANPEGIRGRVDREPQRDEHLSPKQALPASDVPRHCHAHDPHLR